MHLSTALDVDLLVKAGLVDAKWNRQSFKGIGTNSIVVFAVRDGNPKKIKGWPDLLRPGVGIVTPNPLSSGAAKWNILAAYGAHRRLGKTDKQAIGLVERMFRNVVSLDSSGRNATNTFLAGRGDVFITYENEARLAKLQYVIPRQTLLIEAPIAVLKTSDNRDAANRFIRFTKSAPAQRIFAQFGYRPLIPSVYREFEKQYPRGWCLPTRPGAGPNISLDRVAGPLPPLGEVSRVHLDLYTADRRSPKAARARREPVRKGLRPRRRRLRRPGRSGRQPLCVVDKPAST